MNATLSIKNNKSYNNTENDIFSEEKEIIIENNKSLSYYNDYK